MDAPAYGRFVRIGRWTIHFSSLHLVFLVLGLTFLGQVLLNGAVQFGGSLLEIGAVGTVSTWASGAVAAQGVLTQGEWWRLFSGMFLHASILHLLLNAMALQNLGRLVDRIYGPTALLAIYLLCGLASSLASVARMVWLSDEGVGLSVGASGAICGFLGVLLGHALSTPGPTARWQARQLTYMAFTVLAFGFIVEHVDNAAHIGGFAMGWGLSPVIRPDLRFARNRREQIWLGWVTALLSLLTLVALAIAAIGAPARNRGLEDIRLVLQEMDAVEYYLRSEDGMAKAAEHVRRWEVTGAAAVAAKGDIQAGIAQGRGPGFLAIRKASDALVEWGFSAAPDLFVPRKTRHR